MHAGLDDSPTTYGGYGISVTSGAWVWTDQVKNRSAAPRATVSVTEPGTAVFSIWMREDGTALDKIILTTDSNYAPEAQGPAESARVADDTDGDGMPDYWELVFGLDLLDPSDAAADLDGDGLINSDEFSGGTDPTKEDHPALGLIVFTPFEL